MFPPDSANMHEMQPLLLALAIVATIFLIADIVILIRWLIYRVLLQESVRTESATPYWPPVVAGTSDISPEMGIAPIPGVGMSPEPPELPAFDIGPQPIAEPLPDSEQTAPYSPPVIPPLPSPAPGPEIRSPFASTWSLVDPFVGIQVVVVTANVLAVIPLLPSMISDLARGIDFNTDPAARQAMLYVTIFGLILTNALFVAIVAFYLRRYGLRLADIGLRRPTRKQILRGLTLGAGLFVLASLVEQGLAHFVSQGSIEHMKNMGKAFDAGAMFQGISGFWAKLLFALCGAIAAPIGEEVFFRGFLYNALKQRWNVPAAIILSGLAFAISHASPLSLIVIFPMGMLLAYVYERTHSLWITILMHAVNNSAAFLLMWLFPQMAK